MSSLKESALCSACLLCVTQSNDWILFEDSIH